MKYLAGALVGALIVDLVMFAFDPAHAEKGAYELQMTKLSQPIGDPAATFLSADICISTAMILNATRYKTAADQYWMCVGPPDASK